jgi:hypothetical protein
VLFVYLPFVALVFFGIATATGSLKLPTGVWSSPEEVKGLEHVQVRDRVLEECLNPPSFLNQVNFVSPGCRRTYTSHIYAQIILFILHILQMPVPGA